MSGTMSRCCHSTLFGRARNSISGVSGGGKVDRVARVGGRFASTAQGSQLPKPPPRFFEQRQPLLRLQEPGPKCWSWGSIASSRRWSSGGPSSSSSASRNRGPSGPRQTAQHSVGWRMKGQMEDSREQVWWIAAGSVAVFGCVFAFVPLYKLYCQSTGQGHATATNSKEYSAPPLPGTDASKRLIKVDFTGTVHTALPWEFVPQQRSITVGLGETALAFYRAKNHSTRPIIGVSVYHMIPPEAGLYFNKIQCFCFDEQLINPEEEVDLPIFFFIDPLWGQDSRFDHIDRITLSYLFFESDSDVPEEYEDYIRASRTNTTPLPIAAPGPSSATALPFDRHMHSPPGQQAQLAGQQAQLVMAAPAARVTPAAPAAAA